jgi:hypothetical protein
VSIVKLQPAVDADATSGVGVQVSLQHDLSELVQAIVRTRAIRAFDQSAARYAIRRRLRCASRRKVEAVFDDLAVHSGLSAQRIDEDTLVLDGSGIFIYASGYSKGEYCSCNFEIWTTTVPRVEEVRAQMLRLVGDTRLRDEMFVIDWQYRHARGGGKAFHGEGSHRSDGGRRVSQGPRRTRRNAGCL